MPDEPSADNSAVRVASSAPESEPDQSYYWTEEWQAGERAADAEIEAGGLQQLNNAEELYAYFRALSQDVLNRP